MAKAQKKQITMTDARRSLGAVITAANKAPVELTSDGEPVAVVLSLAKFRTMETASQGFWERYEQWRRTFADQLDDEDAEVLQGRVQG